MSAATTITAPAVRQEVLRVAIDDDATPLVRQLGRTLRDAIADGHAIDAFAAFAGSGRSVAIRSHDTPQAATLTLAGDAVIVSGGVLTPADTTVVVDLHARFTSTSQPAGDADLAAAVLRALTPPIPHWRAAAARFWEVTRAIPGIPDVLVVAAETDDGTEHGRFGEGESTYLLAGPAYLLAGVFSGADDLIFALGAGLRVQGTLSQLSVMTAASWKVRFDV